MRNLVVVLVLAGCGSSAVVIGGPCTAAAGSGRCTSSSTVAYCEAADGGASTWAEYPGACAEDGGAAAVDFSGQVGQPCPHLSWLGEAHCAGANAEVSCNGPSWRWAYLYCPNCSNNGAGADCVFPESFDGVACPTPGWSSCLSTASVLTCGADGGYSYAYCGACSGSTLGTQHCN